jgi:hypothetical protein
MTGAWLLFVVALNPQVTSCPIRSHNDRILRAEADAERRSATFQSLVRRVSASDLIIYAESGRCESRQVLSCLSLVSAAGGFRYLRITIDTEHSLDLIASQLAHELQHAVEIADAPQVTNNDTLRTLYRQIGHVSAAADVYETREAIRVTATVRSEFAARP